MHRKVQLEKQSVMYVQFFMKLFQWNKKQALKLARL